MQKGLDFMAETAMSIYLSNEKTKNYLKSILGERTPQFITSLTSLAGSSENLQACDRNSLLACALKATSMNLPFDPNLGFAWAVPYKTTATFQIGTKGYIQLALRTGQYKSLNARDVRDGELLGRNSMGDPIINWLPDEERLNKKIVGFMAGLQLVSGFTKIIFWTTTEVEKHAERYSKSYRKYKRTGDKRDAIWAEQFEKMAEKTVLKALISKYGPMSTELQAAIQADQSKLNINVETGEENSEYIDNPTDSIVEFLSTEEQRELLEKHGAKNISKVLKRLKISSLDELPKENLQNFQKELEKCQA